MCKPGSCYWTQVQLVATHKPITWGFIKELAPWEGSCHIGCHISHLPASVQVGVVTGRRPGKGWGEIPEHQGERTATRRGGSGQGYLVFLALACFLGHCGGEASGTKKLTRKECGTPLFIYVSMASCLSQPALLSNLKLVRWRSGEDFCSHQMVWELLTPFEGCF